MLNILARLFQLRGPKPSKVDTSPTKQPVPIIKKEVIMDTPNTQNIRFPACGVDLIKEFEGCKLTAYKDIVGVWTIGYGSTGPDIKEGLVWTQAQAEARLLDHLEQFRADISIHVKVALNPNQLGALLSFTYNLGPGCLKMLVTNSKLNESQYEACGKRILLYNKAGGKVVAGLARRREAESKLFLTEVK
jgi:lysozyme